MEVLMLTGAVAATGYFVRSIDRRNRSNRAESGASRHDDDHTMLFQESGPLASETVYKDDRFREAMRQRQRQAELRIEKVDRQRILYSKGEIEGARMNAEQLASRAVREASSNTRASDLPGPFDRMNNGNRAVVDRFSADLPGSSISQWGGKTEAPALFKPVPTARGDATAELTFIQMRAADTVSDRMDGVPLTAPAAQDMPLSDVDIRLNAGIMPRVGADLNPVKFKVDRANNRNPLADRMPEAPPIVQELRKPRNPLASRYETWIAPYDRATAVNGLPNRETEYVSQQIARSGRARKRFDEETPVVRLSHAGDAGQALQPRRRTVRDPSEGFATEEGGGLLSDVVPDALRPRNRRPGFEHLAVGPIELTRFDARDVLQRSFQEPDPTKKEEVIMANPGLNRHLNVDQQVDNIMQDRGAPPKATGRELLMHAPRLPLADNSTRLVGGWPLLQGQRVGAPKVGRRETNIFSHDPDSGLIGPKTNNLWIVADGGRSVVEQRPPRLNLREMLSNEEPRRGMANRPDLEIGSREKALPERDAKIYDNAHLNRPPATFNGSSHVANSKVGSAEGLRQRVDWDGHARAKPSAMGAPSRGPDRARAARDDRTSKARKLRTLELGASWPGEHL